MVHQAGVTKGTRVAADSGYACAASSHLGRDLAHHIALVILLLVVVSASARVQEDPCDRGLEGLARGPHGYALRGDRCEGIYAQQVAGTTLILASLTQSFEDYDLTSGDDWALTSARLSGWSGSCVRVAGQSSSVPRVDAGTGDW